jgi:AbrB family looped-hinge helix DNA binding protein
MIAETSRVGKRGTIVIPAAIRRHLKIEEGAVVMVEKSWSRNGKTAF